MAAIDTYTALLMVKTRLNRLPEDHTLDDYLYARIDAAAQALESTGIILTDSTADLLLVVDYTVWEYQNRDQPGSMPDWLRLRRRERWLQQRRPDNDPG